MGRIVHGQIITDTSLDSHGERLPEEAIRRFYDEIGNDFISAAEHDLTQAPVVRIFNKLERTETCDLAIKVDAEILDEERYSKYGGFSLGFTRRHWRFGTATTQAEHSVACSLLIPSNWLSASRKLSL